MGLISWLWSGATSFIRPYINAALIATFVALAAIAATFWLQGKTLAAKNEALQLDKERLQAAVGALEIVIAGKDDAIVELEETAKVLDAQNAELNSTLTEIRNAPPADNGPIAPVLDRTLRRIDAGGVRVEPKSGKPKGAVHNK